ncbi:MAG: toxin-antitoxin system YwqK family antitoxin [Deltaproteobacteria bacterium]|nr:toxin-antitoxin system YwqK family antitoxin [Deltaproteobacteria bacterium]
MELSRAIPASPFSAGSGLPGRELTPAEQRMFALRHRLAQVALAAVALAVPVLIGVIVVAANEPRTQVRTKYFNSGGIEEAVSWSGAVRHGPYTQYFTNGQRRAEGSYYLGEKDGQIHTWHWNGALESTGFMKHGVRVGRWEHLWPSGALRAVEEFHEGLARGRWQTWYVSGVLESESVFGPEHGMLVERRFYDAGTLHTEIPYVDGLPHGLVRAFWPDGRPQTEGRMAHGERDGLWVSWDESGALVEQARYLDGELLE